MVGQPPPVDILMTSGDACPTNVGRLKVAAECSLIKCLGISITPHNPPVYGGKQGGKLSNA
ncbi:MAG: hypothetical protein CV087_13705 [Candidatus Brocadia sp. WS118]|nr:MAG: hypothetical protein CV087_13705 [Candidatus Brocadia sp. WS118]